MDGTKRDPEAFAEIGRWVTRCARPADLARWRLAFADDGPGTGASGSGAPGYNAPMTDAERSAAREARRREAVEALAAYQNADGGFGHALEADSWNPDSSPLTTSTAVGILDEIGWADAAHPVVQGILRYLDGRCDMDEARKRWLLCVPSNDLHPHAPWWGFATASAERAEFNPTGILAGFLMRHAARGSERFAFAEPIARELLARFLAEPRIDMHPLACVLSLLDGLKRSWFDDAALLARAGEAAMNRVHELIEKDRDDWGAYACRPSFFVDGPEHPLAAGNEDAIDAECDFLLSGRGADGVWGLSWSWGAYEREFAVAETWWKADVALRHARFLRAFGRI